MPLVLQVEILSKAESDAIWQAKGRAENFAEYLAFINAREVGDAFRIPVAKGDRNAADAKEIRTNFNLAAKEREGGPVHLSWKVTKHPAKRNVKKDGKTVEEEYEIIDSVSAIIVAGDVPERKPRQKKDEQPAANADQSQSSNGVVSEGAQQETAPVA